MHCFPTQSLPSPPLITNVNNTALNTDPRDAFFISPKIQNSIPLHVLYGFVCIRLAQTWIFVYLAESFLCQLCTKATFELENSSFKTILRIPKHRWSKLKTIISDILFKFCSHPILETTYNLESGAWEKKCSWSIAPSSTA